MGMTLHVALGPRDPAPSDVAIVVDCIRATTTISHALAAGYGSVVCVGEIDDAFGERADGVLLGGERHGVKITGFDLGNSPAEYDEARGEREEARVDEGGEEEHGGDAGGGSKPEGD